MPVDVKICGISTPDAVDALARAGARYAGFVFFPRSPRHISIATATQLARQLPTGVRAVALFVEPSDSDLDAVLERVQVDTIQLHGHETPGRVAEIRARYSHPVIKALPVATATDLDQASAYGEVADMLLFDAKPPKNVSSLPGGNGLSFDWSILTGRQMARPWMLSGGLTAENLAEAVGTTGAKAVDLSSGVESRPGVKDPARIRAVMEVARSL